MSNFTKAIKEIIYTNIEEKRPIIIESIMRGPAEIHVTYRIAPDEETTEEQIFNEIIYLPELLEFMINHMTLKDLLHESPNL